MTTNDDDGLYTRIAWREAATLGAAVAYLADGFLRDYAAHASQRDRRALARTMLRHHAGRVEADCYAIEWHHEDGTGDVLARPA